MRSLFSMPTARVGTLAMVATTVLGASPLAAQQTNASVGAYGMGGNYTAMARNADAVAWNPAALSLKSTRPFSISLLNMGYSLGLDPVRMADLKEFSGITIPASTRQKWLTAVRADGKEAGGGDLGINWLAMNIGRFGVQASTTITGKADLNGDAFEAIFFGNAGATGQPKDLNFAGSSFRTGVLSTFAASYAIPLGDGKNGVEQGIGVTGKMVMGHFLAMAQDNGTAITTNNIAVQFPIVHTNTDKVGNSGSGFGLDLGYVRKAGATTLAASVRNIVNSFAWNSSAMVARVGSASFDGTTNSSNFDEAAYSTAPSVIRQAVSAYQLKPSLAVGIAHDYSKDVTVTVDLQQQFGDEAAMLIGPKTQVGAGVEYRGLSALPLRAGASYITNGFAVSGGTSLHLGSSELGLGVRYRSLSGSSDIGLMFSLLAIR
jgi:hypothetical protein